MSGSDERARGTSPRARGRTVQVTTRRGRLLQRLVGQEPSRQSVGVSREVVPRSLASVGDERSGLARAVRTGGNGGGSKRGPEGNEADFVGGNEVGNNSPHRCPVTRAHRMKPADRFGGGSGHWWRRRCKPRRAAGPRGVSPPIWVQCRRRTLYARHGEQAQKLAGRNAAVSSHGSPHVVSSPARARNDVGA